MTKKINHSQINIRPVRPEDVEAVARVEARCFPAAEAATAEEFAGRIDAFGDCFFVLEHEGVIIGFINGCATDERTIRDEMFHDPAQHKKDGAYQSIFGLDVAPEYGRQGLGARLMEHMIGDARNRGRRGLILTCKEKLIHYYESFGYVNQGISQSTHGGAVWYDMVLEF